MKIVLRGVGILVSALLFIGCDFLYGIQRISESPGWGPLAGIFANFVVFFSCFFLYRKNFRSLVLNFVLAGTLTGIYFHFGHNPTSLGSQHFTRFGYCSYALGKIQQDPQVEKALESFLSKKAGRYGVFYQQKEDECLVAHLIQGMFEEKSNACGSLKSVERIHCLDRVLVSLAQERPAEIGFIRRIHDLALNALLQLMAQPGGNGEFAELSSFSVANHLLDLILKRRRSQDLFQNFKKSKELTTFLEQEMILAEGLSKGIFIFGLKISNQLITHKNSSPAFQKELSLIQRALDEKIQLFTQECKIEGDFLLNSDFWCYSQNRYSFNPFQVAVFRYEVQRSLFEKKTKTTTDMKISVKEKEISIDFTQKAKSELKIHFEYRENQKAIVMNFGPRFGILKERKVDSTYLERMKNFRNSYALKEKDNAEFHLQYENTWSPDKQKITPLGTIAIQLNGSRVFQRKIDPQDEIDQSSIHFFEDTVSDVLTGIL